MTKTTASRTIRVSIATGDKALLTRLCNPAKPVTGTKFELDSNVQVEVENVSRKRDLGDLHIIELLIRLPEAVAAHLIAIWLHDKISGTKSRISINGRDLRQPDAETIRREVEKDRGSKPET